MPYFNSCAGWSLYDSWLTHKVAFSVSNTMRCRAITQSTLMRSQRSRWRAALEQQVSPDLREFTESRAQAHLGASSFSLPSISWRSTSFSFRPARRGTPSRRHQRASMASRSPADLHSSEFERRLSDSRFLVPGTPRFYPCSTGIEREWPGTGCNTKRRTRREIQGSRALRDWSGMRAGGGRGIRTLDTFR